MEAPCKNCQTRKAYARAFDIHFWGEDCPYECEEYEHWKEFQRELNGETDDGDSHSENSGRG